MRRYAGQALRNYSRIAVIANDAIGNFVVTTPLMQMLRTTHDPAELHYFGGTRTWELQRAGDLATCSYPLFGLRPTEALAQVKGRYDLVVNVERTCWSRAFTALIAGPESFVCGPCLDDEGRRDLPFLDDDRGRLAEDMEWISPDLTARYPFLKSGFIGEIFVRLAYLDGPVPPYRVATANPGEPIPDVLIATAASLPEKTWPVEKWRAVLSEAKGAGVTVGLLGAAPSAQRKYWEGEGAEEQLVVEGLVKDLRGRFSLPQVVGALSKARAVLTIDNGILHLAVAAGTPSIGLYRHGIHRLWAPPSDGLVVLTPGERREVAEISEEVVWSELRKAL